MKRYGNAVISHPNGQYYLASDVAARDAQCLELTQAFACNSDCERFDCAKCGTRGYSGYHDMGHPKAVTHHHRFEPKSGTCNVCQLRALLRRTVG